MAAVSDIDLPPFRVDPRTQVLYRDGEIERIPPRTVEVLLALLERRGEIVTKQELLARVWRDTVVEEGNLTVHVSLLRKTLGDAAPIETIAKRGYRIPAPKASSAEPDPAREEVLRGRYFWRKLNRAALDSARRCFERARARDATSAGARSGLADTALMSGLFGFETGRAPFEEAWQHAADALRLDPQSFEASASFGFASLFARWDFEAALQAVCRANELAPGKAEPHLWKALVLVLRRRFVEALVSAEKARAIDPVSVTAGVGLGFHLYLAQQHQPETEPLQRVIELEPDAAIAHWALGLAYDRQSRFAEAEASHRLALGLSGGSLTLESNLARSLAAAGRHAEAEAMLAGLSARGLSPYRAATVEVALGRRERALVALEQGLDERDPWMVWADVDPMLDAIRGEPWFERVAEGVRSARPSS